VTASDFPDKTSIGIGTATLSPDGSQVAYKGIGSLWISNVEGGRPMQVLSEDKGEIGVPWWSPNGDSLAMVLQKPRPIRSIATVKIGSPESFRIIGNIPGIATSPVWSPDGRWIAGGSRDGNIYLISPDGKSTQKLPSPVAAAVENHVLVWSRDSSTIYIASSFAEGPRLDAVDVQTGLSQKIADLDLDFGFGGILNYYTYGSLAPDGQSFITSARVEKSDLWILEGVPLPGRQK
jgi:Tol biopolymer transport system component